MLNSTLRLESVPLSTMQASSLKTLPFADKRRGKTTASMLSLKSARRKKSIGSFRRVSTFLSSDHSGDDDRRSRPERLGEPDVHFLPRQHRFEFFQRMSGDEKPQKFLFPAELVFVRGRRRFFQAED